jgi:hypothetical protein
MNLWDYMRRQLNEISFAWKLYSTIRKNPDFVNSFINKVDKVPELLNVSEKMRDDYMKIRGAYEIRRRNFGGNLSNLSRANIIFLKVFDKIDFLAESELDKIDYFYGFDSLEEKDDSVIESNLLPEEITKQFYKTESAKRDIEKLLEDKKNLKS